MAAEYISSEFLTREEFERILESDIQMLTEWANRISLHYWNVPFNVPIEYKSQEEMENLAYGQFVLNLITNEQRLALSERLVKHNYYNPLMVEKILKHELCHWYCYNFFGKDSFRDGCTRFENEIKHVGAISQFDVSAGLVKVIQHRPKKRIPVSTN